MKILVNILLLAIVCDTRVDLNESFGTAYLFEDKVIGGRLTDTGVQISEISIEDGFLQNTFEISKANMINGISKDTNDNIYVSGSVDEQGYYYIWIST